MSKKQNVFWDTRSEKCIFSTFAGVNALPGTFNGL